MIYISKVENCAVALSELWGASIVVTTDAGETIISDEIHRKLEELHLLVLSKKEKMAEAARKNWKGGRPKFPLDLKEVRKRIGKGETVRKIAKELGCSEQTVNNRLYGRGNSAKSARV